MKNNFRELEIKVGRAPFEQRLKLDGSGFCACPFHTGDSDKSMHLHKGGAGIWRAKCFSTCNESWGPLDFVMKFDNLPSLQDAVERLGGRAAVKPNTDETPEAPKPKDKAMTREAYAAWGRDLTPADVERLARSRKGSGHTAGFETWQALGCRVNGDFIGFPAFHPNGKLLYTLRLRHMDRKEFTAQNAAANDGFFNLDTVNPREPVYVVEGEPDVAVLEEAGYRAVSLMSASQKKFDKHAIEDITQAPEIYIIGDQVIPKRGYDPDPGAECMDRLEAELAKVQHKSFRMRFAVDGIESEKNLKDVSALRQYYGSDFRKRFEELKAKAREWTWIDENIKQISAVAIEPQKWLVNRLLPYGGLTLLCGAQGATKSLFALFLAKYITAAVPKEFLGRKIEGRAASGVRVSDDGSITPLHDAPVAPVPVLYIDRENPKSTVGERRGSSGILGRDNFRYWGDWITQESMDADPQAVYPPEPDDARVLKWAMRTRGFIIFDSLQQWYGDMNENSNTDMVKLLNRFKRVARLCSGVLVLHHTPAPSEDSPRKAWRGGTSIVNIPDMSISLAKNGQGDDTVFELREIRFRGCAPWELDYKIDFNADGQGNFAFGVTRDQLLSDVIKERLAKKEAKVAEKEAKADNDVKEREILVGLISSDRNISKTELVAKSGIELQKTVRLLNGYWSFKAVRDPKWEPLK